MNRNWIKQLTRQLVCVSAVATLPACVAGEEDNDDIEDTSTVGQAATGVRNGNTWYYKTDDFYEACGASKLSVRTSPGNTASDFTSIPRGVPIWVTPSYAWNGAFAWHCGTWSSSDHDYSECDGPTADKVRIYWDPESREIHMRCYEKCGDGSHPDDCAPY